MELRNGGCRYGCLVAATLAAALVLPGTAVATKIVVDTVVAKGAQGLRFTTSDSICRFFMNDDGAVGIGSSAFTIDGDALLHIRNDDDFVATLEAAGPYPVGWRIKNSATTWDLGINSNGRMILGQNGGQHLTVTANGNVCIGGEDNPESRLEIIGTSATSGASALDVMDVNSKSLLFVRNDGHTGLGTTSPVNMLDVEGAAVIGATYSGTNTAPPNGLLVQGNVAVGKTTASYRLDVSGTVKSDSAIVGGNVIRSSGNILYLNDVLSVKTSVAQIYVNGYAYVTGSVTSGSYVSAEYVSADSANFGKIVVNDWSIEAPDYIFDGSHKLPKLKDVEAYVQKHKHLENFPSAKEMKEKGVDLTKMNMALLEKVEQLTLYAIAQQKEIEALKAKMK